MASRDAHCVGRQRRDLLCGAGQGEAGRKKRRSGLWQLSWQLPAVREEQEGVGVYCQNFFRESARVCSSTTS